MIGFGADAAGTSLRVKVTIAEGLTLPQVATTNPFAPTKSYSAGEELWA